MGAVEMRRFGGSVDLGQGTAGCLMRLGPAAGWWVELWKLFTPQIGREKA